MCCGGVPLGQRVTTWLGVSSQFGATSAQLSACDRRVLPASEKGSVVSLPAIAVSRAVVVG